tara:strand:+ start:4023 stop:5408 length:1386 start_codon:yes stop_codon:yes gene_type:complete
MAINTNNITPNTGAITANILYTVNRPVWVSYKYYSTAGTEIPKAVEITVWGNSNGDWLPLGASLYKNKDYDSTPAAPTFTFDISGILKANVTKNFHHDILEAAMASPISMKNEGSNPNYSGMIACRVKAKCYYEVSGVIESSTENATPVEYPASPKYIYAADINISDNIPSYNFPIYNLPEENKSGWLWNSDTAPSINNKTAATNCPVNLRRKIPLGYPLIMGLIWNEVDLPADLQWMLQYEHSGGVSGVFTTGPIQGITNSANARIWNFKADAIVGGTSLFENVTHTWAQMRSEFSLYLIENFSTRAQQYDFELIGYSASNSNITPIKQNTEMIYWINDLGFLDFYYFNGGFEIEIESERVNYVRGNKDFSVLDKQRFGVASGKTITKKTCYTEAISSEVITWLSEILRSTEVFVYDSSYRKLRSVQVVDGLANPYGFTGHEGQAQFSVTYIDNIEIQKD